jgi:hypothetical protein
MNDALTPEAAGMGRKTFILGLGAQKTGSSWLHRQLAAHPKARVGLMKEYHVWDAISVPAYRDFLGRDTFSRDPAQKALRTRLQADPEAYFDHFAELLATDGVTLTCDLTPGYAALPTEVLARIREGFARRDIAVKAVFQMRDPFERCWSSVRMAQRNAASERGLLPLSKGFVPEAMHLAINYRKPRFEHATNYVATLTHLAEVFAPDEVHVGLYETMFTPEGLATLETFLGVRFAPGAEDRPANVTQKSVSIPRWLRRRVVLHYAHVYEYCAQHYPETRDHWPGFPVLEAHAA